MAQVRGSQARAGVYCPPHPPSLSGGRGRAARDSLTESRVPVRGGTGILLTDLPCALWKGRWEGK